jgi:hypothetical protein
VDYESKATFFNTKFDTKKSKSLPNPAAKKLKTDGGGSTASESGGGSTASESGEGGSTASDRSRVRFHLHPHIYF